MNLVIIEDEPILLDLLTDELRFMGFKVQGFNEPLEFLQEIEKNEGLSFHQSVVISDLHMPGISGIELLQKMMSLGEKKPLATVLLTGGLSKNQEKLALEAGIDKIVEKPLDFEDFGRWLRSRSS